MNTTNLQIYLEYKSNTRDNPHDNTLNIEFWEGLKEETEQIKKILEEESNDMNIAG